MPQTRTFGKEPQRGREDRGSIPVLRDILKPFISVELTRGRESEVFIRVALANRAFSPIKRQINCSVDDLESYYGQIGEACEGFGDEMPRSRSASVAEVGFRLFRLLFDEEEQMKIIEIMSSVEFLARKSPESFLLGEYSPSQFLVSSEGINIPWEFIYTELLHNTEEVNEAKFLGSAFFIQQGISLTKNRWATSRPFSRRAGISIFIEDSLEGAAKKEAPALIQLFESHESTVRVAEPIVPKRGQLGLLAKAVNSSPSDIIHFACHAEVDASGRINIKVRDGYYESDVQFTNHLEYTATGAFVFLNACKLAPRKSKSIDHLVATLLKMGYSAVVATEIEIEDADASEFAGLVYNHLFNPHCRSLQKAIFHARRSMIGQGNIAGFTYKFYGSIDLIIN